MLSLHVPCSRAGKLLAAISVLLAAIILLLLFTLIAADRGWLDRPLANLASRKLGRTVRFASLEAHLLSSTPHVNVRDLSIGNPAWVGGGNMAKIEHLSASLELGPLLVGRLAAPMVIIDGMNLRLFRAHDGRNNWTFEAQPRSRAEFEPLRGTRTLMVQRGVVALVDGQRDLRFTGGFQHSGSGATPLSLGGTAVLAGIPLFVRAYGGPLNGPNVEAPYPFQAELVDGSTKVQSRGMTGQPFDFRTFTIKFSAQGPNIADLGYLFDLRLPNSGPYTLQTVARGDGPHFMFDHIAGRFGQSDVTGWLRSDHSSRTPKASGAFWSRTWTKRDIETMLSPLASRASARSRSGAVQVRPASRWLLSDAPFPVENLRGMNFGADLHIGALQGYSLALEHISTRIDLAGGNLTYSSLSARLYGGRLAGRMRLDVHASPSVLAVQGRVRDVQLAQVAPGSRKGMRGLLDADLDLHGVGASIHQAAATAAGTVSFHLVRGSLPPAASYMLGGDTLRAIESLGDSRKAMALDCASFGFTASGGRLSAATLAIQTPAGNTGGAGWIDLGAEKLHFRLVGTPTHRELFHIPLPVILEGSLLRPRITVLPGRNARKLGLKGGLGVALSPVAGLIPMGREPAPSIATCR